MERKKILLIEDEVKLARFVELELKYEAKKRGKEVLVIDRRDHIACNI